MPVRRLLCPSRLVWRTDKTPPDLGLEVQNPSHRLRDAVMSFAVAISSPLRQCSKRTSTQANANPSAVRQANTK